MFVIGYYGVWLGDEWFDECSGVGIGFMLVLCW